MSRKCRNDANDIEQAMDELNGVIERLYSIQKEINIYNERISVILRDFIIPQLDGILSGSSPRTMFSLTSILDDINEYAMEEEWLALKNKRREKTTEVVDVKNFPDSIDDFDDSLGYKTATKQQILELEGVEGLVILGAGGEIIEWLEGINGILKDSDVTTVDDYFNLEEIVLFMDEDIRCLLFPFKDDMKDFNISRLAIVRLEYIEWLKWLSDYQDNQNEEGEFQ